MKTNFFLIVLLIILILLTGAVFYFAKLKTVSKPEIILNKKIDTVYVEVPAKPVNIVKIPAKLVKISDNKNKELTFRAVADTVHNNDTFKITYSYPENYFDLSILPHPDSVLIQRINTETVSFVSEPWWKNPLYFLLGILTGLIAGVI